MTYNSTIIVTGGTSGLGLATALLVAEAHPEAQVVITGRHLPSDAIPKDVSNVMFHRVDLSTQACVRKAASELLAKDLAPISALVLNAGMQVLNEVKTDDGIEAMFAVNHVNQALLLALLADKLKDDCRIVLISSSAHDPKQGRCSPHYISAEDCARNPAGGADHKTGGLNRYGLSKLANVLFGYGLHDHARRTNKGWISLVLDPGCMATGLYREGTDAGKEMDAFIRSDAAKQMPDLYTVEFTANTVLRLVDSEEFSDIEKSGKYYVADGAKEMPSGEQTQDKDLQKDLWDWTYNEVLDENERSKWLGTKA